MEATITLETRCGSWFVSNVPANPELRNGQVYSTNHGQCRRMKKNVCSLRTELLPKEKRVQLDQACSYSSQGNRLVILFHFY